jgi:GT2 family glycosyltransferase
MTSSAIGVVVIGRNEGERLKRCLRSALAPGRTVVYVDSGSSDGSVEFARSMGVDVVALDQDAPFTAARARNAGWARLDSDVRCIQFVDGDCELDPAWIDTATAYLRDHPTVAVVCGRRRERFPSASRYNRLCDLEWDTPAGEAESCGGDAMIRAVALRSAGGYRDDMIAGEEPELCYRLRRAGSRVVRLDAEMTGHDAAITEFRQWWTRAVRAGHAFAEGDALTALDSDGLWRREVRSTWAWTVGLPLISVLLAYWTRGGSMLLLLLYAVLWLRVFIRAARRWHWRDAALYATFALPAKFAHLVGIVRFHRDRRAGRRRVLIEYKHPAAPVATL